MDNLSCGKLVPPPSSGGQPAAGLPSAGLRVSEVVALKVADIEALRGSRRRPLTRRGVEGLPAGVLSPGAGAQPLVPRLFLAALEKAYADGELQFFSDLEPLREASAFAASLAPVRQTEWVVYAKPPFGGPPQVIQYLGRYTHRVAISNQRLVALEDGQVSFRWKDYRHPEQQKVTTVPAAEFIRRFLQHALPPGFQRIRYFGLLANCHRKAKLQLCRQQLAAPLADLLPVPQDYRDFYAALTGKNLRRCPECGIGTMVRIEILPPCRCLRMDTS
jgi:hypothetical protein